VSQTSTDPAIPENWIPPRWLEPYSKRELMWLCSRLDATNRSLRVANRRLAGMLRQQDQETMS